LHRKTILALGAFAAIILFVMVASNVSVEGKPRCAKLSDHALIEKAIQYEITGKKRHIDLVPLPDLVQYKSASDLLQKNPKCCDIDRAHHELTTIFDRTFGATEVWVTLWYRATSKGDEQFYQSQVALDACGEILATRGMSTADGPTITRGK
jgi:hypothetical protein